MMENVTQIFPLVNVSQETLIVPFQVTITYFIFRGIESVLAIGGNLLTIIAVFKFDYLQTSTNYLICCLAAADFLACFLTPIVIIQELYPNSSYFIPVCLLGRSIAFLSSTLNLLSILLISIDRYLYIIYPLRYFIWITPQKALSMVLCIWVYAILTTALIFSFGQQLDYGIPCKYFVFLSGYIILGYVIPFISACIISTCGFYTAIGYVAWKKSRQIHSHSIEQGGMSSNQKKISKMMATVLGCYIVSYMQAIVVSTVVRLHPSVLSLCIDRLSLIIFWINSWINVLIYARKSKDFRRAFCRMLNIAQDAEPTQ